MKIPKRLRAESTVAELAAYSLLEDLTKPQLIVYVRLLAAMQAQRTSRVIMFNSALYGNPRTAAVALRELEERGMIATQFGKAGRTIEVK